MDQVDVLKGMAQRLVEDMDPEKAKGILLAVVDGEDLHVAILGGAPAANKPRRKRGGGRRGRKVAEKAPGTGEGEDKE